MSNVKAGPKGENQTNYRHCYDRQHRFAAAMANSDDCQCQCHTAQVKLPFGCPQSIRATSPVSCYPGAPQRVWRGRNDKVCQTRRESLRFARASIIHHCPVSCKVVWNKKRQKEDHAHPDGDKPRLQQFMEPLPITPPAKSKRDVKDGSDRK